MSTWVRTHRLFGDATVVALLIVTGIATLTVGQKLSGNPSAQTELLTDWIPGASVRRSASSMAVIN